jgi:hypothetical protein
VGAASQRDTYGSQGGNDEASKPQSFKAAV